MSAHISFHGPYTFHVRAAQHEENDRYVEFKIDADGYVGIYLRDREQADALVKAALAARDLLPETEPPAAALPPATHCPICGGKLAEDGSHVSARTGATMAAAEVTP